MMNCRSARSLMMMINILPLIASSLSVAGAVLEEVCASPPPSAAAIAHLKWLSGGGATVWRGPRHQHHHPALHLLQIRGGSSSAGTPYFPAIFPPQPVARPKGSSSSSSYSSSAAAEREKPSSSLWGSNHFDERPVTIEPRTVETLKTRDSRVGLIRKV